MPADVELELPEATPSQPKSPRKGEPMDLGTMVLPGKPSSTSSGTLPDTTMDEKPLVPDETESELNESVPDGNHDKSCK